jgi:predicted signal transduction protein with EAL and GGDEF domain
VARLGGDEFGVMLEGVEDVQAAIVVAERILESLATPIRISGREVTANASVGIAFGAYGDTADQVLRDADAAMYAAKRNGKARFQLFETSMHAEVLAQIELKADLEAAIARQELRLLYQPLVDLQTGAIRGFEALVRWQHPRRGWMSPATFIPFAEQSGLINPIGRWVLWEALRQLRTWQEVIGPDEADFEVTVNLSAKQLEDPLLVEEVERAITQLGIDPSLLVLEITETAMMQSAPERLQELRDLGVRLAMDDFGTGYSSLASLHKLPVDVLKIDRLFVEGIEDEDTTSPFVSTIVSLGQSLGLDMIVEGIETREQFERVRELGCRLGQGFYFARPLEAKQAGVLLKSQVAGDNVLDLEALADGYRDRRLRAVP